MSSPTTFSPSSVPTAEEVLSLVDQSPDSTIKDTRSIVKHAEIDKSSDVDGSQDEALFKSRASFQMSLQSILSSLQSKEMIQFSPLEELSHSLTSEARGILKDGSAEVRFFSTLPKDGSGMSVDQLKQSLGKDVVQIGQGKAFKAGWVKKLPDGTFARKDGVDQVEDTTRLALEEIKLKGDLEGKEGQAKLKDLKSRKLINVRSVETERERDGQDEKEEIEDAGPFQSLARSLHCGNDVKHSFGN